MTDNFLIPAEVFAPVDDFTFVLIYIGVVFSVGVAAAIWRAVLERAKRNDPTREVSGRDFLLLHANPEAVAADLSPAEWAAEAANIQARLDAWRADDEESIDLHAILDDAAWLYMVEVYVADIWMELLQRPMSAPTLHDAAIISLTAQAMDEGHVGFIDGQVDERNLEWLRDECWCWGTPNPACPRHVRAPARRQAEDMWDDPEPITAEGVDALTAHILDNAPLPDPLPKRVETETPFQRERIGIWADPNDELTDALPHRTPGALLSTDDLGLSIDPPPVLDDRIPVSPWDAKPAGSGRIVPAQRDGSAT